MNDVKYKSLVEALKKDILGGKYGLESLFPSERALIRRFGVSRITVQHAIGELERQGLVVRQQGRGTFVTKAGASRKIGLILPGIAYSEFFQPIASALIRIAGKRGYTLFFGDVFSKDREQRRHEARELAANFIRRHVAGVIYQPLEYFADGGETNRQILAVFKKAKIPVVLLDSDIVPPPERSGYDLVSINNIDAGERLARHMMEQGAQNLYFLMRPNWVPNVMNRCRGVKLAKSGKGGGKCLDIGIIFSEPDNIGEVKRCMRKRPRPDAFICENDTTAAILRNTLSQLGYSVPEDVLLAGFDDLQIAQIVTPKLTTIHQPCEDLAEVVFERILFRNANPAVPPQDIFLPAPLVVRESSVRGKAKLVKRWKS